MTAAAAEDNLVDCKKSKKITDNVTVLNKTVARVRLAGSYTNFACMFNILLVHAPSVRDNIAESVSCEKNATSNAVLTRPVEMSVNGVTFRGGSVRLSRKYFVLCSLRHPSKTLLDVKTT